MSIRICAAGRWRYSSLSKASSFQPSVLLQYRHQSTQTPHKVIFSGIQPTGVPHLGNYLGALRQWVKLQNDAAPDTRLLFSLVDLHAITVRQDPKQLLQWKNESLAMLLAIGLDPKRCTIFHQSDVSAHSELMWILSGQASTGYLGRMTQWKEKTANEKENSEKLKLNLFSYPVLQAADVLLHRTTHVPVGHDQAQHLEFAREVANGFNHVYGQDILIPPQTLVSPAKRVMSLTHPVSKMSKSHPNPKSRILLTDSDELIQSKIKSAVTDSIEGVTYEQDRRPGDLAADLANISMRVLKEQVSSAVTKLVAPIRERHESIVGNESLLDDVATLGAAKATESAAPTLLQVKRAVGLCR
ncbi:Tryptophan--tRNA ligase, mitochondrial [Recurvomyces mirabilis]|uniref:tryptophan--tRNA ligase n=1 Tax=Recurvomyces mirabilis TaxID=574656 RepID=A0AAE0WKU3_9PEZI|nr:Tryptophan--tRNA ligase, mitochondrial [Recurvomyces mirabilis]